MEKPNPPDVKATVTTSSGETTKRRRYLIATYLTQLGTALNQAIPSERVALYCQALSDLGEAQLKFAFSDALRNLGDFLPSILSLRETAVAWAEMQTAAPLDPSRRLPQPGDKPPDWEPLAAGEFERMLSERARRAAFPAKVVDLGEFERRRNAQLAALREQRKPFDDERQGA